MQLTEDLWSVPSTSVSQISWEDGGDTSAGCSFEGRASAQTRLPRWTPFREVRDGQEARKRPVSHLEGPSLALISDWTLTTTAVSSELTSVRRSDLESQG